MEDADTAETEYTVIEGTSTEGVNWKGWYVVKDSDVKIDGTVMLTGDTHLILCDGAELTITGGIRGSSYSLAVYAQSNGTGKLTITGGVSVNANTNYGMFVKNLIVYGGIISAAGSTVTVNSDAATSYGIRTNIPGRMKLYGGEVTATGGEVTRTGADKSLTANSYGVYAWGLTVSGGRLTAAGNTVFNSKGDACSNGIVFGAYNLTITGGEVYADGGQAMSEQASDGQGAVQSNGIYASDGRLDLSGGTLTANGNEAVSNEGVGRSCGIYMRNGVYLNVSGGTLTATGGKAVSAAEKTSYGSGILQSSKNNSDTISGGTVTVKGGEATKSCGYDAGNLIISGGNFKLPADSSISGNLEVQNNVTLGDLLPSGSEQYGFYDADSSTWYDSTSTAQSVTEATVKTLPIQSFTLRTESANLVYGYDPADAPTFTVAVSRAEGVMEPVTYQWSVKERSESDFTPQTDATASSFSFPAEMAAGEYEVKCEAACDGYVLEQTATVTVGKADAVCTDEPAVRQGLSYTGAKQELVTAGKATGGTMQYQLDGGEWIATVPTADKAGTYHIRYKVAGDANHNDTAEVELTVTIAKAAPAPDAPLTASVTYGDAVDNTAIIGAMSAFGSTVAGTFVWENVSTYGDATGENETRTLYATFKPADTANYNYAEHLAVAVTVDKAAYGAQTAAGSAKYGASNTLDLSGLIMSGGTAAVDTTAISDSKSILDGTPSISGTMLTFAFKDTAVVDDTATVPVKVTDCSNYENYTITVTLTVNDKNVPTVIAPAAKTLTYNGADQQLIEAAQTTGGTLLYSTDGQAWTETLPTGKNAGKYTVYYKVEGNADYADVPAASIPVTIEKKNVTVKPKSYSITQGNEIPSFALEFDGLANGDSLNMVGAVQFTCTEADGTTPVSTQTVAGTYTITWTNPADLDFTNETNYAVTKASTGTLTISAKPSSSGGSGGYSGGGASGGAPAPSDKPTDKPEQKPSNRPTLDRTERLEMMIRLPLQIISRLPLFTHLTWAWLLNFKLFK